MPFYLKEIDIGAQVPHLDSALVVVCRFCPAASMATRHDEKYLDPLRSGLRTPVFEDHLAQTLESLARRGIRTSVYQGGLRDFMVCVWSAKRRKEFARLAAEHAAVIVFGCTGAAESVRRMLGDLDRPLYRAMEDEGILAVTPGFGPAGRVRLTLFGVTPVQLVGNGQKDGRNNDFELVG
jgi:hypothetical protein